MTHGEWEESHLLPPLTPSTVPRQKIGRCNESRVLNQGLTNRSFQGRQGCWLERGRDFNKFKHHSQARLTPCPWPPCLQYHLAPYLRPPCLRCHLTPLLRPPCSRPRSSRSNGTSIETTSFTNLPRCSMSQHCSGLPHFARPLCSLPACTASFMRPPCSSPKTTLLEAALLLSRAHLN